VSLAWFSLSRGSALRVVFLVALLLGAFVTVFGNSPLLPSLPVLGFGLLLVVKQRQENLLVSTAVKDSPYFLGFILTLIGLMKTFSGLGASPRPDLSATLRDIIGAVGATLSGLVMRQFMQTGSPSEEGAELALQEMYDEIREGARRVREAQSTLVELVESFASTRMTLLAKEEVAVTRYLGSLSKGAEAIGRLAEEYPAKIQQLVKAVTDGAERLSHSLLVTESSLKEARDEYRKLVQDDLAHVHESGKGLVDQLAAAQVTWLKMTDKLSTDVAGSAASMVRDVSATQAAIADVSAASDRIGAALSRLASNIEGLGGRARDIDETLKVTTSSIATVPTILDDVWFKTQESLKEGQKQLSHTLQSISQDAKHLDQAVEDVIAILRDRVRKAAGAAN